MNILFISHDANRAGAQLFLLSVMKHLRLEGHQLGLLLLDGGPLEASFAQVANVYHWPAAQKASWMQRLTGSSPLTHEQLMVDFRKRKFDLIYANTVATAGVLKWLKENLKLPLVTHIHELAFSIHMYSSAKHREAMIAHTDVFIACSRAVAANLQSQLLVPENNIRTVHSFVDNENVLKRLEVLEPFSLRARYSLPFEGPLFAGCGNAEWRKGVDIFLQVANAYKQQATGPFTFMWIGLKHEGELYKNLLFDAERMGLLPHLRIIEPTPEASELIALADTFVVTSREDPFPLVMLEAALAKKPLVGFEQTGGCSEFIEENAGFVVPYLAAHLMAEKLTYLDNNPQERRLLGENAFAKVTNMYNFEQSYTKLKAVLEALLSGKTGEQP